MSEAARAAARQGRWETVNLVSTDTRFGVGGRVNHNLVPDATTVAGIDNIDGPKEPGQEIVLRGSSDTAATRINDTAVNGGNICLGNAQTFILLVEGSIAVFKLNPDASFWDLVSFNQ